MRALWLLLWLLLALPAVAIAQDPQASAATQRLGLFTKRERDLLRPMLRHGPVALAEFSDEATLPAIVIAAEVEAEPACIARLLSDPARYPRFMPALDSVDVRARHDGTTSYAWTWRTAIFTLQGESSVTASLRPRPRTGTYQIAVRNTGGDLGIGRSVWRIYPWGEGRSLIVFSTRIDLRDANYLTRQLSGAGRSVNRSINMSLGFVMVLGTKEEAERLTHGPDGPPRRDDYETPAIDWVALGPTLARGDLLFVQSDGQRLGEVTVAGRTGAPNDLVWQIMTDPRSFGSALVPGSFANVVGTRDGASVFEWGIGIPLIGSSGTMELRATREGQDGHILVDAVEGALDGGHFRFDLDTLPWQEAAVVGSATFDPATASWLIDRIIAGNPYFRHGIAAASQLMVLRAIRSRARRVMEGSIVLE